MPKVLIEFRLPSEENAYLCALQGERLLWAVQQLDEWLRRKVKDTDDSVAREAFESARFVLRDECTGRGVDLDL